MSLANRNVLNPHSTQARRRRTILATFFSLLLLVVPVLQAHAQSGLRHVANVTLADAASASDSSDAVTIVGDVITITAGGSYLLTGTLGDGQVVVNAPGQAVELVLDGVNITSENGPAIVFTATSESFVSLVAGSSNVLTDGLVEHEDYDAALYSVATLTLEGDGTLTVNGRSQEGIASELDLVFNGGTYYITALDDGLNANNDYVSVIFINDGYLNIDAGGDGIDSNGDLVISGGTVVTASALTDASGGLDADGTVTISGGTVVATGAMNSQPSATSTQASIVVQFATVQPAGTTVAIRDGEDTIAGFVLTSETSELVFSSAELMAGTTYDVYTAAILGGEAINGIYGVSTDGAQVASATAAFAGSGRGFPGQQGGGFDGMRDGFGGQFGPGGSPAAAWPGGHPGGWGSWGNR